MQGWSLFLASVAVYSAVPLVLASRRTPYQLLLMYTHLAATLVLGGVLGATAAFDLGGVGLLAGEVALGGFLFSALVTVVLGRDLQVVRTVVVLSATVSLVVAVSLSLNRASLDSPAGPVATGVLGDSVRTVLLGGAVVVGALLLLLGLLELTKGRVGPAAARLVPVAAFLAVLTAAGFLLHTLVLTPGGDTTAGEALRAAVTLAAAYTVPLVVFVLVLRADLAAFDAHPLNLRSLVSVSRAELMERLERQQAELQGQRDQLKETATATGAGRATATVDRILDSATNTILVAMDKQFRITQFNAGAQRLLGWEAAEVTTLSPVMFHSADEVARQAQELGTEADYAQVVLAQVGSGKRRDWEFLGRDGDRHMVSLSITEIVVGSRSLGYLAAGEDVTSRLRAENAVKTALRREHEAVVRLREVNRAKQDLVSTVSHELRTPITSIHGYTELLSDGTFGQLTDQQASALAKVRHNAGRLEALVNDLLVLERAEIGKLDLEFDFLDLRDTVEEAAGHLEEMLEGRSLDVDVELGSSPVRVYGDGAAMERVVVNLLSNAVKFTPGEGSIAVKVSTDDRGAVLTVTDTGIGIDEQDQAQLFNRFFRAEEATTRAIPGSGLGLSVVHAIVQNHGGAIGVTSTPGRGTTVRIMLPQAETLAAVERDLKVG